MSLASKAAEWAMRHRRSLPPWINRLMESAARNPDGLVGRLTARALGSGSPPPPTDVPPTAVRVYIAPTNYAGQAYQWARALMDGDGEVGARNAAVTLPGDFAFPAHSAVPISVVNGSSEWAEAEWMSARRFTHVLVEAERSMFGRRFGRSLEAEIRALEAEGVSVAYLCHGTDIRDPDAHAARTPWSMYPEDPRTANLRVDAAANLALLTRLRRPTFVSTPDLLADVPWGHWCPVVVDPQRWRTDTVPFADEIVRVVHAPSAPLQKGTHLIGDQLAELTARGSIMSQMITDTPSASMPELFGGADVVLDQFRVGSYGVAACEAMAAGRVVVGHVLADVRRLIARTYGVELPIVEATPDTLVEVIEALRADRAAAREIAAAGVAYVDLVHSGAASARVLLEQWIRPAGGS
jgi:hypothetical protein